MPVTAKKKPVNAFASAPQAPKPASPSSKPTADSVGLEGIANYNAVALLIDELKTRLSVLRVPLVEAAEYRWVDEIVNKHKKTNFKGVEGDAISSIQSHKKRANEALPQEVVEILTEHKLPTKEVPDMPDTMIFNPAYKDHPAMRKIGEFIGGLGLPEDFVQHQVATTKTVVTDETIEAFCNLEDREVITRLLPLVTTTVIKPTAVDDNERDASLAKAMGRVLDLFNEEKDTNIS